MLLSGRLKFADFKSELMMELPVLGKKARMIGGTANGGEWECENDWRFNEKV
jgi:hypothetical protein